MRTCPHTALTQARCPAQAEMVQRLSGGGSSGRASTAEKSLERLTEGDNLVQKPFQPKKRHFTFPSAARLGQAVLDIHDLTHGYKGRRLFDKAELHVEKGERVAFIGASDQLRQRVQFGARLLKSALHGFAEAHLLQSWSTLTCACMQTVVEGRCILACRSEWLRQEHAAAPGDGSRAAHTRLCGAGAARRHPQLL